MHGIQVFEIEQRAIRMRMSEVELLQLAREAAHDHRLRGWRYLTKEEGHDLIRTLDHIERDEVGRGFSRRAAELVGTR